MSIWGNHMNKPTQTHIVGHREFVWDSLPEQFPQTPTPKVMLVGISKVAGPREINQVQILSDFSGFSFLVDAIQHYLVCQHFSILFWKCVSPSTCRKCMVMPSSTSSKTLTYLRAMCIHPWSYPHLTLIISVQLQNWTCLITNVCLLKIVHQLTAEVCMHVEL